MRRSEITVGELIDLLSARAPGTPVRLAMNPFVPMEHGLEQVVQAMDATGREVVYLAEDRDADAQLGHLPPEVAILLAWQGPVQAPTRRPRRTAGGQ